MVATITNQGLDRIGINASQTGSFDSARFIRTMSVDDGASGFGASDQGLDDAGGVPSNAFDKTLDSTPSDPSSQVVSHVMTLAVGEGNFTIKRIALHDDTSANVTTTSHTLIAGVDGLSLTKNSDFTMQITLSIQYTDNS